MAEEDRLLDYLSEAGQKLLGLAGPSSVPSPETLEDEWGFPVPLRWEIQLNYIWLSDADGFQVVAAFLSQRAAPSVLAQIRLLWENYALVNWLTESESDRRSRALSLALSEIHDLRKLANRWTGRPQRQQEMLAFTKQMEAELRARAEAKNITVSYLPREASLLQGVGGSRFAYDTLSDIGAHAGLGAPLVFFHIPGTKTIRPQVSGARLLRAYYLGMAFELHAVTAHNIATARGWDEVAKPLAELHDAQADNLLAISRLMDKRGRQ